MSEEDDLRKAIAAACMKPGRYQVLPFSKATPTDWCPHKIQNPETEMCFITETAVFEFIAQVVSNSGNPMEKTQYTIKGKDLPAYVFTPLMPDGKTVYIKVIFNNQMVLGVSFHYSVKTADRRPN